MAKSPFVNHFQDTFRERSDWNDTPSLANRQRGCRLLPKSNSEGYFVCNLLRMTGRITAVSIESRRSYGTHFLRQHRTMGVADFGGSFAPIVQYEKWEIHPVFPHFPYFRSGQNTGRISLPHYTVLP